MTTARLLLVISFAVLGLHLTDIVISAGSSGCVRPPQRCVIHWNVTDKNAIVPEYKVQELNSTLKAIEETNVPQKCFLSMESLLCISAMNNTCSSTNFSSLNVSSKIQELCMLISMNCSDHVVVKTYGSKFCPQIHKYDESECVEVTVASDGYCPNNNTYKIAGNNVMEFLSKASNYSQTAPSNENISDACLTKYKRIRCNTFVPLVCQGTSISKETCEQELQCLPSNSSINQAELCSHFFFQPPTVTTPYDFTSGFNTTMTTRLNTKYKKDYSNKSSSDYKSLAKNVTNGLEEAYKTYKVEGYKGVFIEELSCNDVVAVKHTVVTSSKIMVNVLEAALTLANQTTSEGYLKEKVLNENKACPDKDGDHQDSDSNNWVYMIVFVCITALLLLAMVLCHQSK